MRALMLAAALLTAGFPVAAAELVISEGVDGYTGARDASMFEDGPANAAGAHPAIFAGATRTGSPRRALLQYDLTHLPTDLEIVSVRLELSQTMGQGGAQPIVLRRALSPWGEGSTNGGGAGGQGSAAITGDATWSSAFHPDTAWQTPGGDFSASPSASGTATDAVGPVVLEGPGLADDVRLFLASPALNLGWVLLGNETEFPSAKRFHSAQATSVADRPRLVITTAEAPGGTANLWMTE